MDLRSTRRVGVMSSLLCASSLLATVSLAVILAHWHDALDACSHADCGCLLYARVTSPSYIITGSDISFCWFVGTAPLAGLLIAIVLAALYGYRGFVRLSPRHRRAVQVVRAADGSGVRFLVPPGSSASSPSPPESPKRGRELSRYIALLVVQGTACLFLALFSVAHVAVLTDGILVTCREYRHAVLRTLKASGSLALVVNERLTCPVIFDFLDYMKPDVREAVQGDDHWFPGQRKLTTVNTAAALVISLLASYSCLALWFALAIKFGNLARIASRQSSEAASPPRRQQQAARSARGLQQSDL